MLAALSGDVLAECRALDTLVAGLPPAEWARATDFFGWTVRDQVMHLQQVDRFGLISLREPEAFAATVRAVRVRQAAGIELSGLVRQDFAGVDDAGVLAAWRETYGGLAAAFAEAQPKDRMDWFGPSMSVASFASARIMEVWAHGQDVHDLLGLTRPPTARLRHICQLGVRTFGWSFRNRGREAPAAPPRVTLAAPAGAEWRWNEEGAEAVAGPAEDFAAVVTQRRHIDDTRLRVIGAGARAWMGIAQCFAGAPQDPPPPGRAPL